MQLQHPALIGLGGLLTATGIRRWMDTLDYRVAYYDPASDPPHPGCQERMLFVFWHEYILFPLARRGHCDVAMLLSQHRDAEILSRVAHHLGFPCIRGSTYRGAAASLRRLLRQGRRTHLTITPDGPRGPRRHFAQGAIFLASRLGLPLVPVGFGYDRPWRFNSWDRFALPRPGSRARAVYGPPLRLPPGLDRDGLGHYRLQVERLLNRMTDEAEAWAAAGTRKEGERPYRRETVACHRGLRRSLPPALPLRAAA